MFKSRLQLMAYSGEKKKQYQIQWLANRKTKGHLILGGKCAHCGSLESLEVDHIDPSTKDSSLCKDSTRGFSWSRSWKFIEEELKKCQLLCDTCHNIKTGVELTSEVHGISKYENHGCRCEICRAAKKIVNSRRYSRD